MRNLVAAQAHRKQGDLLCLMKIRGVAYSKHPSLMDIQKEIE